MAEKNSPVTGLETNEALLAGNGPSFLSALKASYETIKLYGTLLGLILGLPFTIKLFDEQLSINNLFISTVICLIPAFLILLWVTAKWHERQNKKRAVDVGISGEVKDPEYFRLIPYEAASDFRRADNVHEAVYAWIINSHTPLLYLSGASGSGKSSIISGWVLPKLLREGIPVRVIKARIIGNPITVITHTLLQPGAVWIRPQPNPDQSLRDLLEKAAKKVGTKKLLLVLDQFEEFLILANEEQRHAFIVLLRSLAESPLPNLQILLILRSDYRPLLDMLGLPEFEHDRKEVPPFFERDAMAFLRGSELNFSDILESEVIQEAREVEQTPGLIRPITINLFGLVLRRFQFLPSNYRKGTLLRSHLRELIKRKEICDFAPSILRCMITENGTKIPVTCASISGTVGLDQNQIRGCLVQLANDGLVRELDRAQGKWEIAHDFIANLYHEILATWHVSIWRRTRPWIIGGGIGLWIFCLLTLPGVINNWQEDTAISVLREQGFSIKFCEDEKSFTKGILKGSSCLAVSTPLRLNDQTLAEAIPHLKAAKRIKKLDLGYKNIRNIDALKRLTNLESLNLNNNEIQNVDALSGLINLKELSLESTYVEDVGALEGLINLHNLNLAATLVQSINVLKGLTNLNELNLGGTPVQDIDGLKALTRLQNLKLEGTQVHNLDGLKALTSLQYLDLASTKVHNLGGLKALTNLQYLNLAGSQVHKLNGLEALTSLQKLNLAATQVQNLNALKGLTSLKVLILWRTQVQNIDPLAELTSLQELNLEKTQVQNVSVLNRLTSLQNLNIANSQIRNLDTLQQLASLEVLTIVGTQVENVDLMKKFPDLANLNFRDTKAQIIEKFREELPKRLMIGSDSGR